jgi:SAM-dependent methyltransferase
MIAGIGDSFGRLLDQVAQQSPLQRKAISALPLEDPTYLRRAERFAQGLEQLLADSGLSLKNAADAYQELCTELMREMVFFARMGRYSCPDFEQAKRTMYDRSERLERYLLGLSMSQFLWPNHYSLLDFFLALCDSLPVPETILEIGPGHGLFLAECLRRFPTAQTTAVDISEAAIAMSERALAAWAPTAQCLFLVQDAAMYQGRDFHLIIMGEVIEHVDDPAALLSATRRLLAPRGQLFLTTCANCPAPDHVYLFRNAGDIHNLIGEAGFRILDERVFSAGEIGDSRTQLNYGAMLDKEEA